MIKKIFLLAMITMLAVPAFASDYFTARYNLCIPEEGSRNWTSKVSNDVISIDSVMALMSDDINNMTADGTSTVGNVVGRIKLVTEDGAGTPGNCYILIYTAN